MPTVANHTGYTNSFYNPICPWNNKNQISKEDKENTTHIGRKGFDELVLAKDIISFPIQKDEQFFNKEWTNKVIIGKQFKKDCINYLINKGYTKGQSNRIIENVIINTERAKNWSEENEYKGNIASKSINFALALGIIKRFLDFDFIPKIFKYIIKFAYGYCQGNRAYNQYSIHARGDDDAGQNHFESDMYGNKIAGELADATVFFETKVKPLALPFIELLPNNLRSSISDFISLPNLAWWRSRMPAHINQEYFTDLLRFIVHKPLSLFDRKKSKEILKKVKERGNIELNYIKERHYKNAGLLSKKDQTPAKFISTVCNLFKNSFSCDLDIQKNSSRKLNETIAPILGIYGFFSVVIGFFTKGVLGILNYKNRFVNFLSSSGIASEQIIYLFRFVLPLNSETKELRNILNNKGLTKTNKNINIRELKDLYKKKKALTYIGISCVPLSIINSFLKLTKTENGFLQKSIGILEEISDYLISKFFSERRYIMGKQFRILNPEFYES